MTEWVSIRKRDSIRKRNVQSIRWLRYLNISKISINDAGTIKNRLIYEQTSITALSGTNQSEQYEMHTKHNDLLILPSCWTTSIYARTINRFRIQQPSHSIESILMESFVRWHQPLFDCFAQTVLYTQTTPPPPTIKLFKSYKLKYRTQWHSQLWMIGAQNIYIRIYENNEKKKKRKNNDKIISCLQFYTLNAVFLELHSQKTAFRLFLSIFSNLTMRNKRSVRSYFLHSI